MPALYVVATPIGNLEDITLRAIRILKEVKLIAAEDTRKTRQLLSAYDIKTPTTSYHEHNKLTKLDYILNRLENEDVALVSDAGMPGISDPGYELISAVNRHNIPIIPFPGHRLLVQPWWFRVYQPIIFFTWDFYPIKPANGAAFLNPELKKNLLWYFLNHLTAFANLFRICLIILGDRKIAVCRELTKIHEEIFRGTLSQAIEHFTCPRGEFTLVIAGKPEKAKPEINADIEERLRQMRESGLTAKEAITQIAEETGLSKKELYQTWIKIK